MGQRDALEECQAEVERLRQEYGRLRESVESTWRAEVTALRKRVKQLEKARDTMRICTLPEHGALDTVPYQDD